jgi:hypothetical protein
MIVPRNYPPSGSGGLSSCGGNCGCKDCGGMGDVPADFITGASSWLSPSTIIGAGQSAFSAGSWFTLAGIVGIPILALMLVQSMGGGGRRGR